MRTKRAKKGGDELNSKSPSVKSGNSSALIIVATAADTTWRMFVPTLGGTGIGLWLDGKFDSAPWFGIGGLIVGVILTAGLVRQQYKKVNDNV